MTWDPSIPDTNTSPGLLPTTAATNWTRLQTIVGADHQFNFTAASTDGYHKISHWVNQAGTLSDNTPVPIASVGQLYTKTLNGSEHLCYQKGTDNTGEYEAVLSLFPVRAAVIFTGTGAIGAQTLIGTPFNVASVMKTATGVYTVNFTNALPSTEYIPLAIQNGSNNVWGQVDTIAVGSFVITGQRGTTGKTNFTECRLVVLGG